MVGAALLAGPCADSGAHLQVDQLEVHRSGQERLHGYEPELVAYDPTSDRDRLKAQARSVVPSEQRLLERVLRQVRVKDPLLCDVGCAQGDLTVMRFGDHAFRAFDPSSEAISQAQVSYPHGRWVTADATTAAGIWSGEFDLCWSSRVLQHVEDPAEFLASCLKLVHRGGFAVVTFPDDRHNAATPTDGTLQWLLRDVHTLEGVSRRYGTEEFVSAAMALNCDVWVELLWGEGVPGDDEVQMVFDWRLKAVERDAPEKLDECRDAVEAYWRSARDGKAWLMNADVALVMRKR